MTHRKTADYGFTDSLIPFSDLMEKFLTKEKERENTAYDTFLLKFAGLQMKEITGPHTEDRNCVHWPIMVGPMLANRHGHLHGGMAAYLLDTFTTLHLIAVTGNIGSVSVNISLNYLRPVPLGRRIIVKTFVIRSGKSTAFLEAHIVDGENPGRIYVIGTHTKAVISTIGGRRKTPGDSSSKL